MNLSAPSVFRNDASLPFSGVRVLERGVGGCTNQPCPLCCLNNDQAASPPPACSSPSPHCPAGCGTSTFPHLIPASRKASLSSMALPQDLLVIFTSIANSEEAAGAQSQTSSLLQNVRTRNAGVFLSPGKDLRCRDGILLAPSLRILDPHRTPSQGFRAQGLPPQLKAQTLWLGVSRQGMESLLAAPTSPVHLPFPGPDLFLILLVAHRAGPKALNSWTTASPP